jgi:uncharacterized protein (DUF1501 family)
MNENDFPQNSNPSSSTDRSVDGARYPLSLSRRQLLQMLGVGSLAAFGAACTQTSDAASKRTATGSKTAAKGQPAQAGTTRTATGRGSRTTNNKVLIVLELQGGHDGFSMLVPYTDDRFRKLRDRVWIDPKELHLLDDRYAIAKGLAPVAKRLSFIEGVGVAKPNLSHFDMLQRWWQGDPEGGSGLLTGFLGRCCDASAGGEPVTAVSLGGGSTPSLISAKATTVALPALDAVREISKNEEEQRRLKRAMQTLAGSTGASGLDHGKETEELLALARRGLTGSLDLASMVGRIGEPPKTYPDNDIAQLLAITRQLISLDAGIKVFHIPWGSFDTHTNGVGSHSDHMNRLGVALEAFAKDLETSGLSDRVLLATTSEFGRRPEANQSGTDHGTASTMLMMGPIKTGRHGQAANFKALDNEGNVKATTMMTDYYATLASWIGVRPEDVLPNNSHAISTLTP